MYKHILIASDGSELAGRAVEQGLTLAKTLGSKVTAVTVTEPWTAAVSGEWAVAFPVEEYEKAAAANAQKILAERDARRRARIGIACETVHIKDQFAAEGIVEEAKARGCDLIVMGSHGRRGLAKFVLGSQAIARLNALDHAHAHRPLSYLARNSHSRALQVVTTCFGWLRCVKRARRPTYVLPPPSGPVLLRHPAAVCIVTQGAGGRGIR